MADNRKVAIVILNWNNFEDTKECLDSLKKIDYPNYEVIVVDNGSEDGSAEKIARAFPHIKLIRNRENLGFAEGNNVGIKEALKDGPSYILLLNNDTVVDGNMLSKLVGSFESDTSVGIAGPKIYYYGQTNIIWSAGVRYDRIFMRPLFIGYREKDSDRFSKLKNVDEVSACAMLIRKEVIEKIGYLDEKFFTTAEDSEYCIRAKMAGYRIFFIPEAKVWHKVSSSTGGEDPRATHIIQGETPCTYSRSIILRYCPWPF